MRRRSGRNPKSPAFQFYPADFLSDGRAAAMTYEERGVLITLLSFAWLDGGIPADHSRIQRILRMGRSDFVRVWAEIGPCFTPHPDKPEVLVNARMERERASQAENRKARKAASDAANAVRWNKDGSDSDPNRSEIGHQTDPTLSRIPSPVPDPDSRLSTPDVVTRAGKPRRSLKPEVLQVELSELPEPIRSADVVQVLGEFLVFRKTDLRDPVTPIALRNLLLKLEPHGTAVACAALRESMSNGWKGVFPEKCATRAPRPSGDKPASMREWFARQAEGDAPPSPRTVDVVGGVL